MFYKYRLPFSLSCDNLLLSGNDKLRPSPTKEILHLARDVMNSKGKPELQVSIYPYLTWIHKSNFYFKSVSLDYINWLILHSNFGLKRTKKGGMPFASVYALGFVLLSIQKLRRMLFRGLIWKWTKPLKNMAYVLIDGSSFMSFMFKQMRFITLFHDCFYVFCMLSISIILHIIIFSINFMFHEFVSCCKM